MLASCQHGPSQLGMPFDSLFTEPVREFKPNSVDFTDVTAVVFWGGADISPSLYGEKANKFNEATDMPSKRDIFEWGVMQECQQRGVLMIGVCRGAQLMCAFAGGKLAQDVGGHLAGHTIVTHDNKMFGAPANHHQMLIPPEGAKLLAWAGPHSDGKKRTQYFIGENEAITWFPDNHKEPEAVYFPNIHGIGFQYHPEWAERTSVQAIWTIQQVKEALCASEQTLKCSC